MVEYENYSYCPQIFNERFPSHWKITPIYGLAKEKKISDCTDLELLSVYLNIGVIPFSYKAEKRTNVTSVDLSKYQVGQRVYHKKFGEGTITKLEQEGNDVKVDLEFDKAGHKRLMAKFAGLEIIG